MTANLTISPVTAEDTAKHFYLEASNEHGRLEYAFELELTPDPAEATYEPIQVCATTLGGGLTSSANVTRKGCGKLSSDIDLLDH